ncbi:MAG: hypothetical protein U9R19_01270, partial [Bacteroidota bacterium]|nr:hypothetical protein [Bacteroidota bacterium]
MIFHISMNTKYYFRHLRAFGLVVLLIVIFVSQSVGQEQGSISIRNYSPTEYFGYSQNMASIQDKRGVMYFANSAGILEYDGNSWRTIELENKSIPKLFAMDSTGRVYVGGVGEFGFLEANDRGEMSYHSLLNKIEENKRSFDDVWFIHSTGTDVFFNTDSILFRYRNGKITSWKEDCFGPLMTFDNITYLHCWEKGIMQIVGDSLTIVPNADYLKGERVLLCFLLINKKMLVGTMDSGLYLYDLSKDKNYFDNNNIQKFETEVDTIIENKTLYSVCEMSDGRIALGTLQAGVCIIDKKGKLIQEINVGLRNNMIWHLSHDTENNLWMATNNGISKIDINSPISFWDLNTGLENSVDNICRFNDTLFVAGFGGVQFLQDNKFNYVSDFKSETYCLLNFKLPTDTSKNILLAGTTDFGIVEMKNQKFKKVINLDPWDMYQPAHNLKLLYIATDYGLSIATYENKQWELLGNLEGVTENIRGIEEDKNGDIWLSTFLHGIIRIVPSDNILKPKKVFKYGIESGLPSINYSNIYKFDKGLIFSIPNYLLRFNEQNSKFIPDSTFGIEYCNGSCTVYNIEKDSEQKVWIAGIKDNHDFIHVLMPDEKGKYTLLETNALNMMPPMSITLVHLDPDNTVWISGSEGLFRFKGELKKSSSTFTTLIRKINTRTDTLHFGTHYYNIGIDKNLLTESVPLPYSQNSVNFQYASPSFLREKATVYQTWLEGLNESWSPWSLDTKKEYLNLSEGTYRFHVRGKNVFNTIGSEAVYEFTISPPWHRTYWAYLLYFLFLSALVYLIVYLNGKRLVDANIKLDRMVKERTTEVNHQKEELRAQSENLQLLNEELAQQNEEIISQSDQVQTLNTELKQNSSKIEAQRDQLEESVATKNRFFNIVAHDLRSPFQSLIGLSELLSTESDQFSQDEILEMNESIYKSATSGFVLLENLLDWARSQTDHIEYKPENISASELINESFQILGSQASNKNISLKLEIEKEVFVFADQNMVDTVFRNLISNAIKFTHEKGEIS